MKHVLITGITGFTGRHLVNFLSRIDKDISIFGTSRNDDAYIKNVQLIRADFTKSDEVKSVIGRVDPDHVYHLASCNRGEAKELFTTNVLGTINLLEAIKHKGKKLPKVLLVGSVAEYGIVNEKDLPIKETTDLKPVNPYGHSKLVQELIGFQYYNTYGLNIVLVRPANIIGPGQSAEYVCSAIAKQIVEIEEGKHPNVLTVGNLKPQRNFIDVRDAIDAYWKLMNSNNFGRVFNICSQKCLSISEVIDNFLLLTDINPEILIDPIRIKGNDIMLQECSYTKLYKATGWYPKYTIKNSFEGILEYWRLTML